MKVALSPQRHNLQMASSGRRTQESAVPAAASAGASEAALYGHACAVHMPTDDDACSASAAAAAGQLQPTPMPYSVCLSSRLASTCPVIVISGVIVLSDEPAADDPCMFSMLPICLNTNTDGTPTFEAMVQHGH